MATLDNPGWYEHAEFTAPGHADPFFKWLDQDEYVSTTGDVDSPLGWVGLIKVDEDQIRTWVSSQGDPWMSEARNFSAGWYIVRQDSNGLVWGLGYGGWCDQHQAFCADTYAEQSARADFAETEAAYLAWGNSHLWEF